MAAVPEAGVFHDLRVAAHGRLGADHQVLVPLVLPVRALLVRVPVTHARPMPLRGLQVRAVPVIRARDPRAGAVRLVGFLHRHTRGQVHPNGQVPASGLRVAPLRNCHPVAALQVKGHRQASDRQQANCLRQERVLGHQPVRDLQRDNCHQREQAHVLRLEQGLDHRSCHRHAPEVRTLGIFWVSVQRQVLVRRLAANCQALANDQALAKGRPRVNSPPVSDRVLASDL